MGAPSPPPSPRRRSVRCSAKRATLPEANQGQRPRAATESSCSTRLLESRGASSSAMRYRLRRVRPPIVTGQAGPWRRSIFLRGADALSGCSTDSRSPRGWCPICEPRGLTARIIFCCVDPGDLVVSSSRSACCVIGAPLLARAAQSSDDDDDNDDDDNDNGGCCASVFRRTSTAFGEERHARDIIVPFSVDHDQSKARSVHQSAPASG